MLIYFLYQYCRRLEENDYQGKPADMAYMLMILFSTTSKYCFHFIENNFEYFSRRWLSYESGCSIQNSNYCRYLCMVQS